MEILNEIKTVLESEELSADAMVAEVGEIINAAPKPKRTRAGRKLTWNERQYGAGLIAGIGIGICIGIPLDAALAVVAKLFVGWLFAW